MINKALLDWYDANARPMPWRIPPADSTNGIKPDPYHIWLSEVMLQQTTVAAVIRYFLAFQKRWPDVHSLANADDADVMGEWAGLGYYARARNLLKCARVISTDCDGIFPDTETELLRLPGIGHIRRLQFRPLRLTNNQRFWMPMWNASFHVYMRLKNRCRIVKTSCVNLQAT